MARTLTWLVVTGHGTGWLTTLAAKAEVPVFVAPGLGASAGRAFLRTVRELRVVDSPRAATVLLVVGHIPRALIPALQQVHDQMRRPRATVWWTADGSEDIAESWPHASVVATDREAVAAIVVAHRGVVTGARTSERTLLADEDPVEWRGVGPYGHGGTGMTGGVPYGRPLAGRGDDLRDGLSLDVVPLWVGPFFPPFPAGLSLRVTFAGDIVHAVEVGPIPQRSVDGLGAGPRGEDALATLLRAPVTMADVELGRARHHLRWLASFLHLSGLDAISRRVAAMAVPLRPESASEVAALAKRLQRPWVLGRATAGVGVLTGEEAARWGGPIARAAGIGTDTRSELSAYRALGFEPVVHAGGDARDRWRQRLAEAVQSLELAGRAGEVMLEPGTPVERFRPPVPADFDTLVPALITGAEWGDAVATIASLDIGFDEQQSRTAEAVA